MKNNKDFAVFTLASNGLPVALALNNIAFAMSIEEENEKQEKVRFTRVYLKQVLIDDDSKWVDVKESPADFEKL